MFDDSKRFSWNLINYQFLRIWSFLAQVSTLSLRSNVELDSCEFDRFFLDWV